MNAAIVVVVVANRQLDDLGRFGQRDDACVQKAIAFDADENLARRAPRADQQLDRFAFRVSDLVELRGTKPKRFFRSTMW